MADLILLSSLAVWDPLGGGQEPLMTGHDGISIHTMAGTFAGTDAMFHQNGWSGTESTVGVAGSGFCKQWTPWNRQADACLDGNARWLSVECADYGESFPPASTASDESPPLTNAQIDRIVALCTYWCRKATHAVCPSSWTCHNAGIPAVFVTGSCGRGIAGHRAGIDPWRPAGCPHWSSSRGKICPRSIRLRQVQTIIVPRVAAALAAPVPHPPIPPHPTGENVVYLVQAPGGPMHFTDWLTKRVVSQEDVNVALWISTTQGTPIKTNLVAGKPTGKPIPLSADQADVLTRLPNA